ncbi:uncharacterized protein LOC119111072 [Pollicipes pollicipes]|uniref:uncharacterized protein LOC119111072 n=1 Tax=Pollicipes pollicipes TaxID=41117 RepID=UPI001884B0A2|nr:uncharacterized protein LOC119111072 [Pollicipes pollicipes]
MIVTAIVNQRFMPPVVKTVEPDVRTSHMLRCFAGARENWLCLLIVFFYSFDFLTFESCVAPYVDRVLGITPATLGLYFLAATGSYVLTSPVWARLADACRNPYPMMAACILTVTVGTLIIPPSPLLGLAPRWWLFGLGMTLQEAFFGGAYIPCFQQMLQASVRRGLPDDLHTHAFVSSVYWSVYSLGTVVGPVSGGLLVDSFGFPVMMTCVAALTLLLFLLTLAQAVATSCRGDSRPADVTDERECAPA